MEKEHSKVLIYIQLPSVVSHFCYRLASYRPQHDFTSPATHVIKWQNKMFQLAYNFSEIQVILSAIVMEKRSSPRFFFSLFVT